MGLVAFLGFFSEMWPDLTLNVVLLILKVSFVLGAIALAAWLWWCGREWDASARRK